VRVSSHPVKSLAPVDVRRALTHSPLFSALEASDHRALVDGARILQLGARGVLWRQGQQAHHLGLVLDGRLKVARQLRQREMIVDVVGPGDLVGEVALSLGASYQFDVLCLRRAQVLLISAHELRLLFKRRSEALSGFAVELAQRVLRLTQLLEALNAGTVEQRLARILVNLTDRFGVAFGGGTLVPIRLRREELASMAATTLESTSRRLSIWKGRGWLTPQPLGYLVRDLTALRRLVDRG
jgi:CRP-like cAMP-binding protein